MIFIFLLATVIPSVSEGSEWPGGALLDPPAAQVPRYARNDLLDVERHRLANGLEVWIKPRRETQAVEVRVVTKAGFRHERALDSGISHLLEHMLFKGTERQTESQLWWEIDRRGGSWNGVTNAEATHYFVNIRDTHLSFALEWLEDIIFHSRLAEAHLRQARKDVYSEQGGRYPRFVERIFQTGLFQPPEVRAAEVLIPHAEVAERLIANLEHVDREAILRHYRAFYRPDNMAVIVVGNIDADVALAEVARRFGSIRAAPARDGTYIPFRKPRRVEEIRTRFYPPVGQMANVRYGTWTTGRHDPDRAALRLLCRHLSRRLKEEIRHKRALAYAVGCAMVDTIDAGVVFAYASGSRDAEADLKNLMRSVVREPIERPLTPQELTDAREAVLGSLVRYYESNTRLADFYQDLFISVPFGTPLPDEIGALQALGPADLHRVARSRLQPEAMTFVVARPPLSYTGVAVIAVTLLLAVATAVVMRIRRRRRAR